MAKKYLLNTNYKSKTKGNILILDGKYLAYRTKYSKQNLSYNGIQTGLYFGFFNTLKKLGQKFFPVNTVIMWDSPSREGRRKQQFSEYKNRGKDWDTLTQEEKNSEIAFNEGVDILMTLCKELGFVNYILPYYEADDLIAIWVRDFIEFKNIVITRDEDMYQCLNKNTIIYDPDSKITKTSDWFQKNYKITPEEWTLVKALGGCKSDTVPGIPGVGEKTAIKYIKGEATEKVVEKIEVTYPHLFQKYYELVELPHADLKNVKIPYKQTKLNQDTFYDMCQRFGFYSFIETIYEFEPFN